MKSLNRKGEGVIAVIAVVVVIFIGLIIASENNDANVVSHNISKKADQFGVNRRIVFYNGVTGDYILTIEGFCSLGNNDPNGELSVTCDLGDDRYKKHFLGLSDNVTYFAEQLKSEGVSKDNYKVIFKPSTIIPDIDIK